MSNPGNRRAALLLAIVALGASTLANAEPLLVVKETNCKKALKELEAIGVTPSEASCEANTKKEMSWRAHAPGELFNKTREICDAHGPVTSTTYDGAEIVACHYYSPAYMGR
ncbi:hypothetical protein QZR14_11305 [Pseudomonas sp. rhizo66]|uniref:hypothetical protein n=1 Tax=Pseudomonas sp. rhizo66 TaxID=3059674 RepID=UPI00288F2EFC|nr:hypothetical protein [Pseudomonas sp. rhizo66]MDT3311946.1 hypothetical protein [Pseudomonas sp. rhizo66]